MKNKILLPVFMVLLLFAGFIAVTQETDIFSAGAENQSAANEVTGYPDGNNLINKNVIPEWVRPPRWYRSNKGGMALEEVLSEVVALRNEYALVIGFSRKEKLPEDLIQYYNDDYFIEVRILYENGDQKRTQWILRDKYGTSRVIGVFLEPELTGNERILSGFMEIYDEKSYLICEYNFFNNGVKTRTEYTFKNNLLISSAVSSWEEDDNEGNYIEAYADLLRYNRSLFLRGVERVFYRETKISLSNEPLKISFPRNLSDAAHIKELLGEKLNSYPEFFGEVYVYKDEKIVYTTDERSRITSQTLYDENNNIVWVITNTWSNDRIISTLKKEGDTEYLAEYVYDSAGNRITERNFKNGILERIVHTEGKTDIEELYINNIVVLRAVWEDGRKISETRVENR